MADSEDEKLKETNSGVEKEGDIEEVAEFAEDVEDALKEEDVDEKTVEEFDKWRPRKEDSITDMEDKTVDSAVRKEKELEEDLPGVKEGINEVEKEAEKAERKIVDQKRPPGRELENMVKGVFSPLLYVLTKALEFVEINIYKRLMLKFNDLYFSSEEVFADLRRKRSGKYDLNISIKDDEKRDSLKEDVKNPDN